MIDWNDILHHAFAGAVLALLFSKNQKAWPYFFIGVAAALLPDVTKVLLKDLYLHSLFVAPFISLLIAWVLKLFWRSEPFIRLFGAVFVAIVVGHLVLDFLDNGNAMFYPLIKDDLEYSIISKTTPVVWASALVAIVVGFAIKKVRLLAIIGVFVIILYCGFQVTSKVVVTNALKEQYPIPTATIILYPKGEWLWEDRIWGYHIESDLFLADGESNATGRKIVQSIFYYTPEIKLQYRVEEWTRKENYTLIKCYDEISSETVFFKSEDGIHWSPASQ